MAGADELQAVIEAHMKLRGIPVAPDEVVRLKWEWLTHFRARHSETLKACQLIAELGTDARENPYAAASRYVAAQEVLAAAAGKTDSRTQIRLTPGMFNEPVDAAGALAGELEQELAASLRKFSASIQDCEEAFDSGRGSDDSFQILVDGMFVLDARFAAFVEKHGEAGRSLAAKVRDESRATWKPDASDDHVKAFQEAYARHTPIVRTEHPDFGDRLIRDEAYRRALAEVGNGPDLLGQWRPEDGGEATWWKWTEKEREAWLTEHGVPEEKRATYSPPMYLTRVFPRVPKHAWNLARVLWLDVVQPRQERARQKAITPVRMPTDLATTMAQARSLGGRQSTDGLVMVEPPSGMALTLPFDEDLRVARRDGGIVSLRQVLSPRAQRTYLATLLLYQDAGMRPDGSFEIEGPGTILDVTGASKRKEKKGLKVYERYANKDAAGVREDLATYSKMRVRVVGELEAAAGDPLLDEIRDRRNGKTICYAHARLIAAKVRTSYTQIPRAVCRLDALDVSMGIGIALMTRRKILALLKTGKAIEAPIGEWLDAAGVNAAESARKHGRAFWEGAIEDLSRIAEDGELGKLTRAGLGRDALLTLEPRATLRESYAPLLDAARSHERATRQAKVADKRKPRRG